jgi:uncharacterized membrane protein
VVDTDTEMQAQADSRQLAGMLIGSGVVHMVRPQVFEAIVPRQLGDVRRVVHVSGLAELAAGALLLIPATRKVGGWAAAAVLVGVFPANVQMALDAGTEHQVVKKVPAPLFRAIALARLPLQVPLVLRALRVARNG